MNAFRTGSSGSTVLRAALLASLVAAGPSSDALAQQTGEVAGRVTYSGNGQGVSGALVTLHEAGLGVLTDRDGRYRIREVPPGRHVALAALMGCVLVSRAIDVEAGRGVTLNLSLDPPVLDIEGILVAASASGDRATQGPFAVARLDADGVGLASGTARSVGSMLQGKAAGVRVVYGSGQPGTEASILLRGPTTLLGSQDPLVVIDGVITEGRLSDIDPSDVLRVEVLRGAAAAAGYGSRGQAGVIEITTRRGPAGPAELPRQPVLLVDGVVTAGSLADLNLLEIADIRRLEGPVAAVLYGVGAEAGAIEVTTRNGPPPGSRTLTPVCLDPTR